MARSAYTQDPLAEQNALRDALKSGAEGGANNRYAAGTDIPGALGADPGLRKLVQEQVYTRAYGTGNPTFTTPAAETPAVQTEREMKRAARLAAITRPQPTTTTPTTTTPTTTTPTGSAYDAIMNANNARYGTTNPFDENAIRAKSMNDLQQQIDAIKQRYVGVINEAQRAGEGRLGQQRGLSTVSGTRFSPRGTSEQAAVEGQNQRQIDAINADMNAEIAAAQAAANGFATSEIRYQQEAASKQADSYMNNLISAFKLYQDQQSGEADRAARYAQLTGTIDGAPTLALRQYLTDTQNQSFQNDLANRELEAKIAQANQKNYSMSQLDDGTVVAFDPTSGQMSVLGRYAKPVSPSSTSRYSAADPTSNAAMSAYYSAYGQLPSESLIPYYTDLYSSSGGGLRYNPLPDGQYGPPTPEIYNPFTAGAATYDTRYGRTGAGITDPYATQ